MKNILLPVLVVLTLLIPSPAQAQSPSTRAWEAVRLAHRERLEDLRSRVRDLPVPGPKGMSGAEQHAEWGLKMLQKDGYAEIAAGCAAGKYQGEQTDDKALGAEVMCPIVIDRKALLEKSVTAWAISAVNYFIDNDERALERIEKAGRLPVALLLELPTAQSEKDRLRKVVAPLLDGIGASVPADQLDRVDVVFARRDELIGKLVAAGKLPRAAKPDAGAQEHLREVAARQFDVVKVILEDDEWNVVKNKAGVLLKRSRDAQVLVKSKVGKYCGLIPSFVTQPYEAAGRYGKPYGGQVGTEATLVKCP